MIVSEQQEDGIKIKTHYPYDPNYHYETNMERINLDRERENDILTNKGFIINQCQSLKKELKNPNGIFSTRFGQTLQDMNPFADRYKCQCGHVTQRIHHGITCPICGTKVKYVDDDFNYFGWCVLKDPYYIIHPNLYKSIDFFFGSSKIPMTTVDNTQIKSKLNNMINYQDKKDIDGHDLEIQTPKDEPFFGIGMEEFKNRFQEIMDYHLAKNKDKKNYYDDIMKNKDTVFTQSIPIYTTHLRPHDLQDSDFSYEKTNEIYMMVSKLTCQINNDKIKMFRAKKPKNQLLYDLQYQYNKLYKEVEEILSGKKGVLRNCLSGRLAFTSRNVIVANPKLRIDEVTLPYKGLVELLQQQIINVLHKSYNMSYSDAYGIWYNANIHKDQRVYDIIMALIKSHSSGRGLPIMLNRNPYLHACRTLRKFLMKY